MDFFDIEGFVDDRSGMPKSFSENRIKLNGKITFDTKSLAYRYYKKTSRNGTLTLSGFWVIRNAGRRSN